MRLIDGSVRREQAMAGTVRQAVMLTHAHHASRSLIRRREQGMAAGSNIAEAVMLTHAHHADHRESALSGNGSVSPTKCIGCPVNS
ncbi:hypothetical protein C4D60_Mb05t11350 [Musa balbisiana]|uniref:Uncharacterized protein n=1 Tax=Musa balbisiana TaxID=52838 RepID=A0A4S8JVC9_MUSBA|nr:hypothetical protein C4D60_Mb05t11350 [Musa balbisiana]